MQLWNHLATDLTLIIEDLVALADEGFDIVALLRDCRSRHPTAKWRLRYGLHDGHDNWPTELESSRPGTGARVLVELTGVSGPRPLCHGFSAGGSPTEEARRATLRAIAQGLTMKLDQDSKEDELLPTECWSDFYPDDPRCV